MYATYQKVFTSNDLLQFNHNFIINKSNFPAFLILENKSFHISSYYKHTMLQSVKPYCFVTTFA